MKTLPLALALLAGLATCASGQVTPDMIPKDFGMPPPKSAAPQIFVPPPEPAAPPAYLTFQQQRKAFWEAPKADPRTRRAQREKAAAKVPVARALLESAHGDEAAHCILYLPAETGEKLAAAWDSGALAKLPSVSDLLLYLNRTDKEVALFVLEHLDELRDPDAFEGFLTDGLEQSLGLKKIAVSAAEARARRLHVLAQAESQQPQPGWNAKAVAVGVGAVVALIVAMRWLGRRNSTP